MAGRFRKQLAHAWNILVDQEPTPPRQWFDRGSSYGTRPDAFQMNRGNEKSIVGAIYTRISVDVASIDIRHVRLDDQDRYKEDMTNSGLNNCLSVEANLDQTGAEMIQDAVLTMCDDGHAAIVPITYTSNPDDPLKSFADIIDMRVGKVVEWMPRHVRVELYNEQTGRKQQVVVEKRKVAIVYNPLYSVMNAPNSVLQRLILKLNQLDAIDKQIASGKLDIIIQLPYQLKTETKRNQAESRRKEMELQLKESQYGIAYTDASEKVIQLNRPAENNMLATIQYLQSLGYSQLGINEKVMNGTASEAEMLNYINTTVAPFIKAIRDEMYRKFLTKTARTQKQSILYFRDPFKLVPIANIAEIADKFTRNEIASSNEMRQVIGFKPRVDPKADELRNSNMPQSELGVPPSTAPDDGVDVEGAFDGVNATLDKVFSDLGVDE